MENTITRKNKSNKAFMILSALGILFVVDCHTGNGIGLFTAVFPYDSFFMPMFMFVSGYFFKEKHIETFLGTLTYIKNKFVKLMIPYLLWAIFYGVIVLTAKKYNIVFWSDLTFAKLFKSVLTGGTTFNVNGAAWFVPVLFCVITAYAVLRKIFGKIWNDFAAFIILAFVGATAIYLSKQEGFINNHNLLILKTAFFIQFYQFGIFFKKYIEKHFDKINGLTVCISAIIINVLLLAIYGNITFIKCASMSGFVTDNYFLPLITSVTGIFFWLKISKLLEPVLGNNKVINYISDNTFFIMIHHLFFANVFSAVLYCGKRFGISLLADFSTTQFRYNPWYIYAPTPWIKVAYFLFSITVTLIACKIFDATIVKFFTMIKKKIGKAVKK